MATKKPLHRRGYTGEVRESQPRTTGEAPIVSSSAVSNRPRGRRAWAVIVFVISFLILAIVSLFVHAHFVFWHEDSLHWSHFAPPLEPAAPVDRRRVLEARDSKNKGVISVAQMQRTPLGSEHTPQWPLFWVLTAPHLEGTRCEEIIESWGQSVPGDSLVFIGASKNWTHSSGKRFISLPVPADRKAIKEFLGWKFVVAAFPTREWFVKGDDDTFFIVKNLNRYLEEFDPRLPYFLGCKFHYGGPGGIQYVSGGAGYVLSKAAAQRLAAATAPCLRSYGSLSEGDIAVAYCAQTVGLFPEDTRDEFGRQRFHAFPLSYHLNWYKMNLHVNQFWYYDWVWGPVIEGGGCCGENSTVSFHYMAGKMKSFQFPPKDQVASSLRGHAGVGKDWSEGPSSLLSALPGQLLATALPEAGVKGKDTVRKRPVWAK